MWVRGLKLKLCQKFCVRTSSHPMWVRGLKSLSFLIAGRIKSSHPMWVRGLKYGMMLLAEYEETVAPYVGAWIEILN